MDDLHHALADIAAIRGQMARAAQFRGYGPATLFATALLAALAAALQPRVVPAPQLDPSGYALYWSAAAALAAALIAAEAWARTRRLHHGLAGEMIQAAIEQFLPAAGAGLLATWIILAAAPSSAPLLPGLWQVFFSLGVFASCRFLPRPTLAAGVWYLATGLVCLAQSHRPLAFAPVLMAVPFFVGQSLVAVILWRASRRLALAEEPYATL